MSKQAENPTFRYEFVRFAPHRQIDLHSQESWELDYILTGRGIRTMGDSREHFSEGEVVLVPPEIPHRWEFDPACTDSGGNIENITIIFDDRLLDSVVKVFPDMRECIGRIRDRRDAATLYTGPVLKKLASLMAGMNGESDSERPASFLRILNLLGEMSEARKSVIWRKISLEENRKMKMRAFVSSNFSRSVTLKEIAAHVGMNESAFCVFFKKHYGQTFVEYLNERRLEHARYLLESGGLPVTEVCYACGFTSPSYFSRLFRSKVGMSPQQYAKEHSRPKSAGAPV